MLLVISSIPLPPPVYWNQQLGAKMRFDLWGSVTCGQNLEKYGVAPRFLLGGSISTHRLCWAMMERIGSGAQGQMSQTCCGKHSILSGSLTNYWYPVVS